MFKKIIKKILVYIGYNITLGRKIAENKNSINERLFFDVIKEYSYEKQKKSYDYFKKFFNQSILFENVADIRKFSINKCYENFNNIDPDSLILEFGIWKGVSTNLISSSLKKNDILHAFDSFEGLSEDWKGFTKPKGSFSNNGIIPKLNQNINIIKGNIYDTLPEFLKVKKKKIKFMHLDVDTFETTKYILEHTKSYLTKGSIILFDELHNFAGWEEGAFKALQDTIDQNNFKYIAFSKFEQCVIEIK